MRAPAKVLIFILLCGSALMACTSDEPKTVGVGDGGGVDAATANSGEDSGLFTPDSGLLVPDGGTGTTDGGPGSTDDGGDSDAGL
jgi:hypothetical protein